MNNGFNPVRAKHLESTANVAKSFLAAQISSVTAAVSSELVNLDGMTLDTVQPAVNGALWYQLVDGEPQLRIHYGDHDYSLDNSPGLTVTLNTGSEISYGTPATATVTYRGSGVLTVSASDSNVTPAYSDGTITIPWAAVTGSITITVSLASDGTYIAEEKSFTVSMLQNNPELTVTPAATTLNLAGTTASVTRNGSGAITVSSDNAAVTPTVSDTTITIPYAVFDEDTDVTFSVSVSADSGYAPDTKTFTVTYVSPCVVNMPFTSSVTEDLAGGTWTASGSPSISDKQLYLNGSSYLSKSGGITLGGKDFTVSYYVLGNSSSSTIGIFSFTASESSAGTYRIFCYLWHPGVSGIHTGICLNSNTYTNVVGNFGGALHHIAHVYEHSKSTFKIYIDGVLKSTQSNISLSRTTYPYARIGTSPSLSEGKLQGYIDDFKVYDGVALHTANFTPPARSST